MISKDLLLGLCVAALILMSSMYGCEKYNALEQKEMYAAVADTLQFERLRNGKIAAKTSTIQAQNAQLFLDLESKDSTTRALQEEVKRYKSELKNGGSITIHETVTKFDTIYKRDKTCLTSLKDSSLIDSIQNVWIDLKYGYHFKGQCTDSTFASLAIRDAYTVAIGEEKSGFLGLGKRKPFVEITNSNPYTQTKKVKTFEVTEGKKKKWVIGPAAGITLGQGLILQPFIGAGVTYKIFEF